PVRGTAPGGDVSTLHRAVSWSAAVGDGLLQGQRQTVMSASLRVAIAIPLHNEEETVAELLRRVGVVLDGLPGGPHEIVVVDDGSSDGTLQQLERVATADPRLLVISLSRNFGHQAALSAALDHVSGDAVVTMDGDLQDPPEAIPALLARLR